MTTAGIHLETSVRLADAPKVIKTIKVLTNNFYVLFG
ncbi:MAG: hypothetical protein ACI83B_001376 [Sediminicola sp.]|jgi:hypothetical protein